MKKIFKKGQQYTQDAMNRVCTTTKVVIVAGLSVFVFGVCLFAVKTVMAGNILGNQPLTGETDEWMSSNPNGTFSNTKSMNFSADYVPLEDPEDAYMKTGVWYNPKDPSYGRIPIYKSKPNSGDYDKTGYSLEGWVWNTNIGWIAFNCRDIGKLPQLNLKNPDGSKNPDLFCDKVSDFKVYMTPEGDLRGYAWSMKVGWILFHFGDEKDNSWASYLPKADLKDTNNDGSAKITGYAWSSHLGYFKLDGSRFPLKDVPSYCNNPQIKLQDGYDYAICPTGNTPYSYKNQPQIVCEQGNPVIPYLWTRTDIKDPADPELGKFTVNSDTGFIQWNVEKSYCSDKDSTEVSIAADNTPWQGLLGAKTEKNWKISFCEPIATCSNAALNFKDVNGDDDHLNSYLDNKYSYTVSVPDKDNTNGWSKPVHFKKEGGPDDLYILEDTETNSAVIEWKTPRPQTDQNGKFVSNSWKVKLSISNCRYKPGQCILEYTLTVKGKKPESVSPCSTSALIGQPYECSLTVDYDKEKKATLPIDWATQNPYFASDIDSSDLLNVLFLNDDGTYTNTLENKNNRMSLIKVVKKIREGVYSDWKPLPDDKGKMFAFNFQIKNAYGTYEPGHITVTITDMAIPPEIANDADPSLVFFPFGGVYSLQYGLSKGTPPLQWGGKVTVSGSEKYSSSGESETCSSGNCFKVNQAGLMSFSPDEQYEGKNLKIETIVKNTLAETEPNNLQITTYCDTLPNKVCLSGTWDDNAFVESFVPGYGPFIKASNVKTALESSKQFVYPSSTPGTFDLSNLTRKISSYDQNTAPISGTPKSKIDSSVTQATGFDNWQVAVNYVNPNPASGTISVSNADGAKGVLTWTPTRAGENRFMLKVKNAFGETDWTEIIVNVPKVPEIGNLNDEYTCVEGSTFEKYPSVDADPDVQKWGISNSTIKEGANLYNGNPSITDQKVANIVKKDGNETTYFTINQNNGYLKWDKCVYVGGKIEFQIFAENINAKGYKTFSVKVIPAGDVLSPVIVDDNNEYTFKVGELGTILFSLQDNTGLPEFTWNKEIYKSDLSDLAIITGDNNIQPMGEGKSVLFSFTPTEDDYSTQNVQTEKYFKLNIKVKDGNGREDELKPSGMPKIKIVKNTNPPKKPWTRKVQTSVSGTVNLRGEVVGTGNSYSNIGDVQANMSRDNVFSNVLALTRGIGNVGNGGTVVLSENKLALGNANNGKALLGDNVLYFAGDTIVDGSPDVSAQKALDWADHQTIIVYGGNLFINDNLWPDTNKGTLDIVVLRKAGDLRKTVGNIYIDRLVTNIKANIYADGGLFSYDKDSFNPATDIQFSGQPKYMVTDCTSIVPYSDYADCMGESGKLEHQLKIVGSINSKNTVGGAHAPELGDASFEFDSNKFVNGYGESTTDPQEAIAFDLTLLRFYHLNCASESDCASLDKQIKCRGSSDYDYMESIDFANKCSVLDGNAATPLNSQAVIIEYQPYSPESKVFRRNN